MPGKYNLFYNATILYSIISISFSTIQFTWAKHRIGYWVAMNAAQRLEQERSFVLNENSQVFPEETNNLYQKRMIAKTEHSV